MPTQKTLTAKQPSDLPDVARQLLAEVGHGRVWAFHGEMGAGKTTLIKALCRELGVTDEVASPTFALVHEYRAKGGPVFHLDLYRLDTIEAALDIGITEYLDSGHHCFVEWPALAGALMPPDALAIHVEAAPDATRHITITMP